MNRHNYTWDLNRRGFISRSCAANYPVTNKPTHKQKNKTKQTLNTNLSIHFSIFKFETWCKDSATNMRLLTWAGVTARTVQQWSVCVVPSMTTHATLVLPDPLPTSAAVIASQWATDCPSVQGYGKAVNSHSCSLDIVRACGCFHVMCTCTMNCTAVFTVLWQIHDENSLLIHHLKNVRL